MAPPRIEEEPMSGVTQRSAIAFGNTCTASPAPEEEETQSKMLSKEEILSIRDTRVSQNIGNFTMYGKNPLLIDRGEMQYLFDEQGKKYLDGFGGICTVGVGHCHPYLNKVLKNQIDELWHHSHLYVHRNMQEYAALLLKKFEADTDITRVYFVNSGSEANSLAISMARVFTGNSEVVCLRNAYHGMGEAGGLTSHHTWKHDLPFQNAGVKFAMNPDPLKGAFGGYRDGEIVNTSSTYDHDEAASKYANELRETILYGTSGRIAAFFAEGVQGVGGAVQLADGYLPLAYEIAREHGGVCVSDEVQTGFGRLGSHYWGYQLQGVKPDIVVMAKSMGNGFPLAAVACTEPIAKAFAPKLHFNTFGGNPMACAVGKGVLEVIEHDKLMENCDKVGTGILKPLLLELKDKYPTIVVDVRGRGFMQGVELSRDNQGPRTVRVLDYCRNAGLLLGKGGLTGDVLRIKPPMCWTKQDAEFCARVLEEAFELEMKRDDEEEQQEKAE